ncbi:MAG: adenylate/guanylate cyclase domain-containing protein [Flavobacteriales bacterium]
MPRALLLAATVLAALSAWPQYAVDYDSLEQALPHERDALKRLETVWWLSRSPDLEMAEHYAPITISLADSLLEHGHAGDFDIQTKKGSGLWNWGRAHWGATNVDSTMAWFRKALALWTEIGNQERIVFANSQMAPKLMDQGRIAEGMALLENGLKASEAARDTFFMGTNHNGLGSAYLGQGDYASAIDHYTQSIALFSTRGDDEMAYRYLGDALSDMGLIHADLQQGDSAIRYYRGAAAAYTSGNAPGRAIIPLLELGGLMRQQGDTVGWRAVLAEVRGLAGDDAVPGDLSMLYATLAEDFRAVHRLDSALYYDKLAMELAKQSQFLDREAFAACSMARSLMQLGRLPEALRTITRLQEGPDGASLSLRSRMDMAGLRYEIHQRAGRAPEALAAHLEYQTLHDSLTSESGRRKLIYLDLKAQQIADSLKAREQRGELQVQHERAMTAEQGRKRLFMFAGLGVLVVAGGLWARLRHTRRAKRTIEKEKDRSESLLHNILPAEIAQELKDKGEAQARDIDNVSILFTDFKGFTSVSEQISAQQLVAEINTCFKAFDRIIARHGIEKIKTIGDAYMAAGGLAAPTPHSARNTVLAALEMQAFMQQYKAERDAEGRPAFQMRAGIHTGPVVAGIVGVNKFQYDIWGDTVNTASRMESSGEVGQVNISEATYALVTASQSLAVTDTFTFTPRGKVQAKGKGDMEMYFVQLRIPG